MLPIRASAFLVAATLLLAGCSAGAQPVQPTATATPVTIATFHTPTPRPPPPSSTPIPAPNVVGRVTPPATPTLRPGASARLSVALGGPPSAAQIGLFVARERGYFLDGGVEVFFHATASSPAALASLDDQRDQLALVGGDEVLKARSQGTPVVSVLALDGRGADGYGVVIATTDPLRAAVGPALKAFAAAAVRGYAEVARDPAIAVDALARADSTIDRDAAARQVGEMVPFWRAAAPLGLHDDARWRAAHQRLVAAGQAAGSLDVSAAFTNQLALEAVPTPTVAPSPTARPTVAQPARPTPPAVAPAAPKPAPPTATPTAGAASPAVVPVGPGGAPPGGAAQSGAAPPASGQPVAPPGAAPPTATPPVSAPPPGGAPPTVTPAPAQLQPAPTARVATP